MASLLIHGKSHNSRDHRMSVIESAERMAITIQLPNNPNIHGIGIVLQLEIKTLIYY